MSDDATKAGADRPSVVRIEYEYSDGTILRATGDDAEAIAARIDSASVMDFIHGGRYSGPFLERVERDDVAPPPGPLRCPRCGSGTLYDYEVSPPIYRCAACGYRWREEATS